MSIRYGYFAHMGGVKVRKTVAIVVLVTAVLASCATTGQGETEGAAPIPEAPVISLDAPLELGEILYVSGLGRTLHTVSAEGENDQVLLEYQSYPGFARGIITSHAWSADGSAVAASVHLRTEDGRRLEALYIGKEGSTELRPIFSSPEVSPFYLYWNPESSEVSFVGGDGSGALYLYVVDTESGEMTLAHRGNNSLYWSWTDNGEALITNSGGSLRDGLGTLRLHRRRAGGFDARVLTQEERSAGRFQVPDVADNERIAVALRNEFGTNTVAVVSPEGTLLRRVADFDGVGSLSWSPNGRYLAYVEGNRRFGGGIVGTLEVVDTDRVDRVVSTDRHGVPGGGRPEALVPPFPGRPVITGGVSSSLSLIQQEGQQPPSQVLSFIWSPDSSRILFYEPRYIQRGGELTILMEASLLDPESGEQETLGSYRPAPEFLRQVLPFYDQYARSSTVWSPEGRRIVFNGINEAENQAIFVIDLDNREVGPVEIAEGVVPLWRP